MWMIFSNDTGSDRSPIKLAPVRTKIEATICPRARGSGLGNEKLVRIILLTATRENEENANRRADHTPRRETLPPLRSLVLVGRPVKECFTLGDWFPCITPLLPLNITKMT